ncbi:MAG TPA: hypothetical protein PL033_06090 [Candidatus Brocadiia bacterium]|nr:hypothetical protein [Candidatus Brocadiia bacterium]
MADTVAPPVEVTPGTPMERWHIALISAAILILELAFIRLVPSQVKAISYFTNLLLMSSFFGMGLGCILQNGKVRPWLIPLGMVMILSFVQIGGGITIYENEESVHYWFVDQTTIYGVAIPVPLFPAAVVAFIACAVPFVTLGQQLAVTMDRFPRLIAYSWNIVGSLAGTLMFALSSFFGLPPWIWPPLVAIIWGAIFIRKKMMRVIYVAAGLSFLTLAHSPHDWKWSPYYFIQYQRHPAGLMVWVNSSYHQFAFDFQAESPEAAEMCRKASLEWEKLYEVYRKWHDGKNPQSVLILGAGTGNDVEIARRHDASKIVAVEIDPTILWLGKNKNTTKPYDDPRVTAVVDDARHYLHTTNEKFDLIVFGYLDSQVLLSGNANLRLENYVYTRESLEDARALLNDGGMVGIYYSVFKPWLYKRIYATLSAAFGDSVQPFLKHEKKNLFNFLMVGAKGIEGFRDTPENIAEYGDGIPCVDDWPYLYLESKSLANVYKSLFIVIIGLVALAFLVLRRTQAATGLHVDFLFLGLGFTLMEASAVVRLSLVFGNTWVVNAVVFSLVLLEIFLANLAVMKNKAPGLRISWIGLCASILVNFFFPIPILFEIPTPVRIVACGILIGTPVFFAAICFSRLFEAQKTTGYALGVNLIGAMAGGFIEYSSMMVGMKAVWLIALVIYIVAWIASMTGAKGSQCSGEKAAHS